MAKNSLKVWGLRSKWKEISIIVWELEWNFDQQHLVLRPNCSVQKMSLSSGTIETECTYSNSQGIPNRHKAKMYSYDLGLQKHHLGLEEWVGSTEINFKLCGIFWPSKIRSWALSPQRYPWYPCINSLLLVSIKKTYIIVLNHGN